MKDEIIMIVTNKMIQYLNNEQLCLLKDVLTSTLCKYEIKVKDCELINTNNNSITYLNMFLESFKQSGKSDSSIDQYKLHLYRFLKYLNKNVENIDDDDVINYIRKYKEIRKVSQRYLNNIRLVLNSFFKWLQRKKIIIRNPVDGLEPIKYKKSIKTPFTADELERMRYSCNNERDLSIIEFLYSSAVRVSELTQLNIDDICWENNSVVVLGKGNKEREVYINAKAKMHLKKYLELRSDDNPALFVSLKSPYKRLEKSGVESLLKRVGLSAGVKNVHPHRFRRTSATDLLRMGMPIEQVQELLGHTKLDTTRIYCTVTKEQVKYSHRKYM